MGFEWKLNNRQNSRKDFIASLPVSSLTYSINIYMVRKLINHRIILCIKVSTRALAPGHGWAFKMLTWRIYISFAFKNEFAGLRVNSFKNITGQLAGLQMYQFSILSFVHSIDTFVHLSYKSTVELNAPSYCNIFKL